MANRDPKTGKFIKTIDWEKRQWELYCLFAKAYIERNGTNININKCISSALEQTDKFIKSYKDKYNLI